MSIERPPRDSETLGSKQPLLQLQGIKKYFNVGRIAKPVRAVDGISLSLARNETLSLVGESGSGKSTVAKLVLQLERPTAGTVQLDGRDVTDLRGRALREHGHAVQAVFQDPWSSLNPRMRVRALVAEPLLITRRLGPTDIERRVVESLEAVGLDPSSRRKFPHEFSGGQRQRIAIARALAPEPDLVVLDEPVSALDVSIRAQIMNLLKDIQASMAVSYLLIAHDLATVRYLSDRVCVMYLGQVVEAGSSEAVFTSPRHPYTFALLAAAEDVAPEEVARERIILRGEVPSPSAPPAGCRFHTRCWLYDRLGKPEQCRAVVPELAQEGPGHQVACHFSESLRIDAPNVGIE